MKPKPSTVITGALALIALTLPLAAQRPPAAPKPKPKPFTRLKDGKPNLQGYWSTRSFFAAFDLEERTQPTPETPPFKGVVVDPPDGKIPYQPWALEKRKDMQLHHLYEDPQAHCFLSGVPRQMYTPFGFQILQPKDHVLLLFEAFHAYRIIPLNGGPHVAGSIKLFEGDSRGHWEGDTLVVDVTNQHGRTWFDMSANFHSEEIHVVERYTPIDADTFRYQATIEDPKVFTRPWTIAFDMARNPDPTYEQLEFACVEGEQDLQHYVEADGGKAAN